MSDPFRGAARVPLIEVETFVAGSPDDAYAMIKDMEAYPRFMEDVVSLRIVQREEHAYITEWVARLQGRLVRWTERDEFDDSRRVQTYRQVSGDLKRFEGQWRVTPAEGGARVYLSVDFELGIPMLAGLLNPVARLVAKRNAEHMLAAIKERVERAADGAAPAAPAPIPAPHGGPGGAAGPS